jgi:hypothetical protein
VSSATDLYLLDTNILVHYVRGSPVWRHVRDTYAPLTITPTPLFCMVSEGEIRSLALQRQWGAKSWIRWNSASGFSDRGESIPRG